MGERRWLLYGAYGYTGRLIVEGAVDRGEAPILAGRAAEKLDALAIPLGLETRAFGLDDPAALAEGLRGVDAVLHAAGPFSATARPMVDACLAAGCAYLDITGELAVFEAIHARDAEAREAGVALLPGVGFDVVPTDCLAALLARDMPDASHLELGIHMGGGASGGTTKTMVEGLATGSAERIHGRITPLGAGSRTRWVPFADKTRHAVGIPWGDVSTAYYSTGIDNIRVYMAMPARLSRWLPLVGAGAPLLGLGPVQGALKKLVEWRVRGPSAEVLESARSQVWGEVRNPGGEILSRTLSTPQGYAFTADAALRAVRRVLDEGPTGALTPSLAFGPDFVAECDGVELGAVQRH